MVIYDYAPEHSGSLERKPIDPVAAPPGSAAAPTSEWVLVCSCGWSGAATALPELRRRYPEVSPEELRDDDDTRDELLAPFELHARQAAAKRQLTLHMYQRRLAEKGAKSAAAECRQLNLTWEEIARAAELDPAAARELWSSDTEAAS